MIYFGSSKIVFNGLKSILNVFIDILIFMQLKGIFVRIRSEIKIHNYFFNAK